MARIDRDLQRNLLNDLAAHYPDTADYQRQGRESEDVRANLAYLEEHELVTIRWTNSIGSRPLPFSVKITAKGMDFLADDGGLSAILGVVTIKLHEDTLKALLVQKVEAADGDSGVKQQLISKIKAMPAEALGSLTQKSLDAGLEQIPDLVGWLHTLLGP